MSAADSSRPPSCGPAGNLGSIKISSASVDDAGYCTFCNHGPERPNPDSVFVIEGGRSRIVMCSGCLKLIREQWNKEVADPHECWME